MGLFGFLRGRATENRCILSGSRVLLRPPEAADYEAWSALRQASRRFLEPWEPLWPSDDLTPTAFRARLARAKQERDDEAAHTFFVFDAEGRTLMGGATLGNIRRRAAQSATLGYWMGAPFAGQGIMSAAVQALVPFAFGALALERIEAACLPENIASVRVLEKCGFQREGLARAYLSIAGSRRDHFLFGLVRADFEAAQDAKA